LRLKTKTCPESEGRNLGDELPPGQCAIDRAAPPQSEFAAGIQRGGGIGCGRSVRR
jgi:hypothetical protein